MSWLKWVIRIAVGGSIAITIPIFIYYQVVKPKNPLFNLQGASVNAYNLTDDGHLTAIFEVWIRAHNPNHKLKLKYSRVRVLVYKYKQKLATDALPGFTQRKGNVTVLKAEPVALHVRLKKGAAFDFGVERGMGYLNFDVIMTSNLGGQNLRVECKHLEVNVTSVAASKSTQNFQRRSCDVFVYSNV